MKEVVSWFIGTTAKVQPWSSKQYFSVNLYAVLYIELTKSAFTPYIHRAFNRPTLCLLVNSNSFF